MTDIIIVNWNSKGYLKRCVDSIFKSTDIHLIQNIIIVDNNSSDNSLNDLPSGDKVVVVKNKKNEGFAKASNQGFHLSKAPFVLLLNPDTMLLDNTLADCIEFMNTTPDIDILGCRLIDEKGNTTTSCSRFPQPLYFFYETTGLSKISPRLFRPATIMRDWDHSASQVVDQVMGAFMFMRKNIFEKVGYFDERFFVYLEDVDFSKRLALAGGKSYYNSEIKAVHTGEGTTKGVKAFRLFLYLRNRLLYSKKYFSIPGYLFVWFITFFIEPFSRIAFFVLSGHPGEVKEIIKAFLYLLKKTDPAKVKLSSINAGNQQVV